MVRIRIFQPIQVRHSDVQDDDVGLELLCLLDSFPPIARFGTNLPLGMGFQQCAETAAHDFVIISDQ